MLGLVHANQIQASEHFIGFKAPARHVDSNAITFILTTRGSQNSNNKRNLRSLAPIESLDGLTDTSARREFSLYEEKGDLAWANDPMFMKFKRLKFQREADCDTDEETVEKEQKKCFSDLKDAVNKFVRFPPETFIENLHQEENSSKHVHSFDKTYCSSSSGDTLSSIGEPLNLFG